MAGYPTGVTPPDWLSASQTSSTASSATMALQVTTTNLPVGNYSTTIRFVTGKSDGTNLVTRDVPVSYRVNQGVKATETTFVFTANEGTAPVAQVLHLSSDILPFQWAISVESSGASPTDWLTVSTPTGSASTATTIQVLAAARTPGSYGANLVLRNGNGVVKATIPVTYTVAGVFELSGMLTQTLDQSSSASALSWPLTLKTNLGSTAGAGQHWQITSSQPWITVSPSSGDLSSDTNLTAQLNPTLMGSLPNGPSSALLTVHLTSSAYSDQSVPVVVNLNLPLVKHVAPYATWVDRASPVILRGSGFPAAETVPVRFSTEVATGTVVSPTEIHVTAPGLAMAGRLPVSIDNALGIARTGADLVVLPKPGYAATSQSLPPGFGRLVEDPERRALLVMDYVGIRRIRFKDGAWSQDSLPLESPSGVFVGLDGKDLFATAGNVSVSDRVLRLDPETFATKDVKVADGYYENYSLVASFNDGRTFVFDSDQWLSALQYPDMTRLYTAPSVHGAIMLVTRDHSRILLHTTTSSGMEAYVWDADAEGPTLLGTGDYAAVRTWGISQDGERYLNGHELFDHAFQKRGNLSIPGNLGLAALSQDGSSVFTLADEGSLYTDHYVLRKVDVTAASGPYVADATPLPLSLEVGEVPSQLLVSEDGSTLFLLSRDGSGNRRFRALPLP